MPSMYPGVRVLVGLSAIKLVPYLGTFSVDSVGVEKTVYGTPPRSTSGFALASAYYNGQVHVETAWLQVGSGSFSDKAGIY